MDSRVLLRKESNLKITERLKEYFEKNPNIRFHQALYNLSINTCEYDSQENYIIKDKFYEESLDTLKNIKDRPAEARGVINDK